MALLRRTQLIGGDRGGEKPRGSVSNANVLRLEEKHVRSHRPLHAMHLTKAADFSDVPPTISRTPMLPFIQVSARGFDATHENTYLRITRRPRE